MQKREDGFSVVARYQLGPKTNHFGIPQHQEVKVERDQEQQEPSIHDGDQHTPGTGQGRTGRTQALLLEDRIIRLTGQFLLHNALNLHLQRVGVCICGLDFALSRNQIAFRVERCFTRQQHGQSLQRRRGLFRQDRLHPQHPALHVARFHVIHQPQGLAHNQWKHQGQQSHHQDAKQANEPCGSSRTRNPTLAQTFHQRFHQIRQEQRHQQRNGDGRQGIAQPQQGQSACNQQNITDGLDFPKMLSIK